MLRRQHLRLNQLLIVLTLLLVIPLLVACGGKEEEHYTIGIINLATNLDSVIEGFKGRMAELGYVEGENITYIYDGPAPSIGDLDGIAQKLVDADVDMILSVSTPATQAAQRATADNSIPVVFAVVQDPIVSGIVTNLSEPGGNITGITFGPAEGKRLEWLTQVAPGIERVYIPYNVDDPAPNASLELVSDAADKLGVELVLQPARNTEEVAAAIENIPDDVDAMMTLPDSIVSQSMNDLIAAAIEHKLPYSVTVSGLVARGALTSYGMESVPVGEQSARLADQILKGTDPGDIPVEVAEFFLSVNLKTADAIGLEISDELLKQINIVIRD